MSANQLSESQQAVFNKVIDRLSHPLENGKAFLVEGAAGSGKTFLLNNILGYCEQNDIDVFAMGYTGIASCALINGHTVHSQFRLSWTKNVVQIDFENRLYKEIRKAPIFVWDQAANCNKNIFDAVDRFLRAMMNSNQIFGGKVAVVCCDFRECLPIARNTPNETRDSHSLLNSPLFNQMQHFTLHGNYRFEYQTDYRFCLEIGAGIQNEITVPNQCRVYDINTLINTIYYDLHSASIDDIMKRSIITLNTADVDDLNEKCVELLCSTKQIYESFNCFRKIDPDERTRFYSFEHTMANLPSYFQPNILVLGVNCPIMLTHPYKGIPKGTRLIVKSLKKRSILAEIATGERKGKVLRIYKKRVVKPFPNLEFVRYQFPVTLAFSMTINKAQAVEFNRLGLYLPCAAFAHGQMYAAFSRVPVIERDLKVYVAQQQNGEFSYDRLPNIVNETVAMRFRPINL